METGSDFGRGSSRKLRLVSVRGVVWCARLAAAAVLMVCAVPGAASATPGYIYTVAGNGTSGYRGDGESAPSAELNQPGGVAGDASGDLLIADTSNQRVRLVAGASWSSGCPFGLSSMTTGNIYTVAGGGSSGYSGDGGPATSAQLSEPHGVAVDASGDLLIVDTYNQRVRLVAGASCSSGCPFGLSSMTKGYIYTIAGNGSSGYGGDVGPATSAQINDPSGVAIDGSGNLLIADTINQRVRLVAGLNCASNCPFGFSVLAKSYIYTVAGDGSAGYGGDGWYARGAQLDLPYGVAFDGSGDLRIADTLNHRVRLVAGADCSADCPFGLAATYEGAIYTVAGNGFGGYGGDGMLATSASLYYPRGVAVDGSGDLLIADTPNSRARLVAASQCSAGCPFALASMTRGYVYTIVTGPSGDIW